MRSSLVLIALCFFCCIAESSETGSPGKQFCRFLRAEQLHLLESRCRITTCSLRGGKILSHRYMCRAIKTKINVDISFFLPSLLSSIREKMILAVPKTILWISLPKLKLQNAITLKKCRFKFSKFWVAVINIQSIFIPLFWCLQIIIQLYSLKVKNKNNSFQFFATCFESRGFKMARNVMQVESEMEETRKEQDTSGNSLILVLQHYLLTNII